MKYSRPGILNTDSLMVDLCPVPEIAGESLIGLGIASLTTLSPIRLFKRLYDHVPLSIEPHL